MNEEVFPRLWGFLLGPMEPLALLSGLSEASCLTQQRSVGTEGFVRPVGPSVASASSPLKARDVPFPHFPLLQQ